MTDDPRMRADAATAGLYLITVMLVVSAAGFGLGSLAGLAVPFGLLGLFVGLGVGLALVYRRFKNL